MMWWVLVLLGGSISCSPVPHGFSSDPSAAFYPQPFSNLYWSTGGLSPDDAAVAVQTPVKQQLTLQPGAAPEPQLAAYSPIAQGPESPVQAPEEEVPEPGEEAEEPVFSDVSNLEPVYSFKSRSRYQRGRAVFAETTYIPGPPPAVPAYPSSPVKSQEK
ncbi:uncharacterized protein ACB058_008228 [Synchiropus picturatus]